MHLFVECGKCNCNENPVSEKMRENNPSAQRASWGMTAALHVNSSYICTIWVACMYPMFMFLAGLVPARAPRGPELHSTCCT